MWLTTPGPYRATICRERELTPDHIHTFWPHKDMPGPPPRQQEHERRYTPSTHPFILTRRVWKDDYEVQMIFGDLVGLKRPDICLTGEEKPRKKTSLRKPVATGDRTRAPAWQGACYRLFHSGRNLSINTMELLLETFSHWAFLSYFTFYFTFVRKSLGFRALLYT